VKGELQAEFADTSEAIYGVSLSSSSRDIITLSPNGNLKIWSVGNAGEVKELLHQACQWMINYPIGGKVTSPCKP
jgi:hypothetical protein